jgi:SulP family sulfate permease
MGEWREFAHLRQYRMPYRATLLAVFLLTVVFDLTVAVEVGLVAACITFIYRISSLSRSEEVSASDQPLLAGHTQQVAAYRLYGAIFFGAVKLIEELEDHLPARALVLDFKNVMYIDSSGADTILDLVRTCQKQKVRLVACGLKFQPKDILQRCGLISLIAERDLFDTLADAIAAATQDALPASH